VPCGLLTELGKTTNNIVYIAARFCFSVYIILDRITVSMRPCHGFISTDRSRSEFDSPSGSFPFCFLTAFIYYSFAPSSVDLLTK